MKRLWTSEDCDRKIDILVYPARLNESSAPDGIGDTLAGIENR